MSDKIRLNTHFGMAMSDKREHLFIKYINFFLQMVNVFYFFGNKYIIGLGYEVHCFSVWEDLLFEKVKDFQTLPRSQRLRGAQKHRERIKFTINSNLFLIFNS